MKNILKKLGVFGLICAVLSPFASVPKVNAENCEHHLQNYLFLDVTSGETWKQYYELGGYRTFTSYIYTFPQLSSGQTLRIDSVGEIPLDTGDKLASFYSSYNSLILDSDRSTKELGKYGTYDTQKYGSSDYKTETTLLHGYWSIDPDSSSDASSSDAKRKVSNYELKTYPYAKDENTFKKHTIQGAILNNEDIDFENLDLNVTIGGAKIQDNKYLSANAYLTNGLDFFQTIVNDTTSGSNNSLEQEYVWEDGGKLYLNLNIRRELSEDDLNELNFGSCDDSGVCQVWTTDSTSQSITDSYTALARTIKYDGSCPTNEPCGTVVMTDRDIDIRTDESYYWPVIYSVEYSVCTNVEETTKWTLKYNANVDDPTTVANMPGSQQETVGKSLYVSTLTPTRTGYTFAGWNTKSDGSGDSYKSKDEVKNSGVSTELELFAQWKKTGTTDSKDTGVVSYIIGFAAVGVVAGGIYLISKKKNLFKQI